MNSLFIFMKSTFIFMNGLFIFINGTLFHERRNRSFVSLGIQKKQGFYIFRQRPPSISENTSVHRGLDEGGLFSTPPSDLPETSLRTSLTQK